MSSLNRQLWLTLNLVIVPFVLCCTSGCMNPYYRSYGYGAPYSGGFTQPGYAPAPAFNAAPGSLYIPESPGAPYVPGSLGTYDENPPDDDFNKPPGGSFYGTEDDVPGPRDLPSQQRDGELGRPTTFNDPASNSFGSDSGIRQVSGTMEVGGGGIQQLSGTMDHEYGFDTNEYRSLTGVLRYDSRVGGWAITYSLKASDRYAGTLSLAASAEQIQGLSEGDNVDVFGYVDESVRDRSGQPVYRVTSITRI